MIIKLKKGESLKIIAKKCGLSEEEIVDHNGFTPLEEDYISLPKVKNVYVVKEYENPIVVAKKTGLSIDEVNKRCGVFTAGKVFYY